MLPRRSVPCALSVGGLDPGGGAGVLADARGFEAAGVFPAAVVAALTVQSTRGLASVRAVATRLVVAMLEEVLGHQRVGALKTGALGSAATVRAVARIAHARRELPLVVDPVVRPTRGLVALADDASLRALRDRLLPLATLVTANADEARALTGLPARTVAEATAAARRLVALGARAAMVKGGHMQGADAVDVLVVGARVVALSSPRFDLGPFHGGGCLMAAMVAGRLAREPLEVGARGDAQIVAAVRWAKRAHAKALGAPLNVGGRLAVVAPNVAKCLQCSRAAGPEPG